MAMASIWSTVSSDSQVYRTIKGTGKIERGRTEYCLALQKDGRCLSPSLVGETDGRWRLSHHVPESFPKVNRSQVICLTYNKFSSLGRAIQIPLFEGYITECRHKMCSSGGSHQRDKTYCESDPLKALDSYFSKLECNMDNGYDTKECQMESSSHSQDQQAEVKNLYKRKATLDSLKNYFGELNNGQCSKTVISTTSDKENSEGPPVRRPKSAIGGYREDMKTIEPKSFEQVSISNENIERQTDDEVSDFYLINILAAINIAVFLFEIASPIRNSELEQLSIPLIYGGKINKLILVGEWWRLVTPMFLHSGLLDVSLSCWVLLTFGPQVCRGYGPFTFLLIYILGGICGNLTSFILTPELTVCGTGPIFAIIGAWLVYQIQNKIVVAKELSESMFWKAVAATALSFVLSNFGRIDDWTHLGAALSGIIFGYLTCPPLELLDNPLSRPKDGQKQEGIALVQRQADPCKSLLIFTGTMIILSGLVYLYGPQLELLEMDELL